MSPTIMSGCEHFGLRWEWGNSYDSSNNRELRQVNGCAALEEAKGSENMRKLRLLAGCFVI